MCKGGICDTKPAISLKRSGLEPKLLQSVYTGCLALLKILEIYWKFTKSPENFMV